MAEKFKPSICCNFPIKDEDINPNEPALWDRICVIQYPMRFLTEHEIRQEEEEKLRQEEREEKEEKLRQEEREEEEMEECSSMEDVD